MYLLETESSFDAAHFLTSYEGKCRNIHGHRWRVVLEVSGEPCNGMLVDFGILKKDLKEMCDYFDHTFIVERGSLKKELFDLLNEEFLLRVVDFRTTAENFSRYFFDMLSKKYNVVSVSVYETPTNKAVYRR
ncbi:MAG: 6-carboxytetrahydropterin synthase QueD [Acholeplasmatales bacterium]|nr:6-carboxytetrahydropterin synthase QueD [Acholeplasmatales bacterium]